MVDLKYIEWRRKRRITRYKLRRRSTETLRAIRQYKGDGKIRLLDVGTAEGIMLSWLNSRLNLDKAVGVDTSFQFLSANKDLDISLLPGSGENLPFKTEVFDVIVAASVVDHLKNVDRFLSECYRVLGGGGILIMTAVVPFFDRMATRTRLKEDDHIRTYGGGDLEYLLRKHRFTIHLRKKFALPSFGLLPLEECLERVLRAAGLSCLMFYQLIVGEK